MYTVPMLSARFRALRPYVPAEQPEGEYVKLNTNENPYPPSPAVQKELEEFSADALRLYPDPDSLDLRRAIANMLGGRVTPDMVFAGNGSDEVLSFVFYTFFDPALPVVFPEYTYSFYPVYAGFYGNSFKTVPLKDDYSIDAGRMAAIKSCGAIFPNPNAPTGLFMQIADLRAFLQEYSCQNPGSAVVVDEAYIDFGGETAIPLIEEFPNLIIIRTFSKSFSFAGLRLGFAVSSAENIRALETAKNSFNHFPVDRIAQRLGIAACSDAAYYRRICREIAATRDEFAGRLRAAGWEVLPSLANFVFARLPGAKARDVYEAARRAGFLIRVFGSSSSTREGEGSLLEDFARITIGTPQNMHRLLECLAELKSE